MLRIREHNRLEGHAILCVCVHIICAGVCVHTHMYVYMYNIIIPGPKLISAYSTRGNE